MTARAAEVGLSRRSAPRALLAALRPRQWTKNLLLFAGLVFAAKLGDGAKAGEACAAFAAYCAASSAAYLVNDVRDLERDRAHPVKRRRPLARGEVDPRSALGLASLLALAALGTAAALGRASLLYMCAFLALQAAYSLRLKHVVVVDVLTIGGLFVVRAAAGAAAVQVHISPWLLACTALLALFLGLAKRRGELGVAAAGRPVLAGYSAPLLGRLLVAVAGGTVAVYAAYTLTAHSRALVATVPFVVFGLARYLVLVHRDNLGEEPEHVLLTDVPTLVCVAVWAATAAAIVALGVAAPALP